MSPALSSCWIFLAVLFEKLIVPSYTFSVATPVCTRTTGFHREKEIKSKVPAYRRMMHKAPIVTFNMVNDNDSKAKHFCGELKNDHSTSSSRRQVLSSAVGSTASLLALQYLWVRPLFANAMDGNVGTSPDHPVVVVGAGGKCGTLCTKILANKGLYVRAVTRNGRAVLDSGSERVSYAQGDVTKLDTLVSSALKDASGVIFTASASKNGGDAAHVDYLGLANVAKACVANKVPKLIAISSGAVTRPSSLGFKITNVFGRVMDYKIAGETALREIYSRPDAAGLSYTVVRPGGLSDEKSKGASGVEISQGDILSSEVGREDVSEICVAALLKGKGTDNVSLEVYGAGGKTLFGQKTGPAKLTKDLPDASKFVHRGNSYDSLLDGLLSDSEMAKTGIVGDYKGKNVEPLESLV